MVRPAADADEHAARKALASSDADAVDLLATNGARDKTLHNGTSASTASSSVDTLLEASKLRKHIVPTSPCTQSSTNTAEAPCFSNSRDNTRSWWMRDACSSTTGASMMVDVGAVVGSSAIMAWTTTR